jgi:hypothetical protein
MSSSNSRQQFLATFSEQDELPTVQLLHFLFRPMKDALLVDSNGRIHRVTGIKLIGINWKYLTMGGALISIIALPLQIITLGLMVRIKISSIEGPSLSLIEFKSAILACMASSTSNFKGRGGAVEWRGPVNTSTSFSQLINRLNLKRSA